MQKQVLIILLSFVFQVFTQNSTNFCSSSNNFLLQSSTNPDGPAGLSAPTTVTGLQFCKNLEGKQSCCSSSTINGFKVSLFKIGKSTKQQFIDLDKQYLSTLKNSVKFFKFALQQSSQTYYFQNAVTEFTKLLTSKYQQYMGNKGRVLQSQSNNEASLLNSIINQGKQQIQTYQTERQKCYKFLLKLEGQFKCLGCNSQYISNNTKNGKLLLHNNTCTQVLQNCFNYVKLSTSYSTMRFPDLENYKQQQLQGQIDAQKQATKEIIQLTKKLNEVNIKSFNFTYYQLQLIEIGDKFNNVSLTSAIKLDNITVTQLPSNCTQSNCLPICQGLINLQKGGVDFDYAINPGVQLKLNSTNDLRKLNDRILQDTSSSEFSNSVEDFTATDSGLSDVSNSVEADPSAFQQVDSNSISNSSQYANALTYFSSIILCFVFVIIGLI